jgi:hypothetical protein
MNGSNHNSHDLQVLAAHASGYEPDRNAAEALVASCEDCRIIYEEQLHMRSLLTGVGSAHLTESEQLQLVTVVAGAMPALARRPDIPETKLRPVSPVWSRMMAAAAALAVVIGVGATIASQDGSRNAATTLAADTAASPEFAAGGAGERATVTTAAGAATLQLEAAGGLDELKAEAAALADDPPSGEGAAVAECAEETEELTIRAIGESTYQGRAVLLMLVEDSGEVSPRAFFIDDCTEIALP